MLSSFLQVRFLDQTTFDTMASHELRPYELALSIITATFAKDPRCVRFALRSFVVIQRETYQRQVDNDFVNDVGQRVRGGGYGHHAGRGAGTFRRWAMRCMMGINHLNNGSLMVMRGL